jgi:hypothetical protein
MKDEAQKAQQKTTEKALRANNPNIQLLRS